MNEVLLMGIGDAGMALTRHVGGTLGYSAMAVNTDSQSLEQSDFRNTLQLGAEICRGLPARLPAVAGLAAEQSGDQLQSALHGYDTVVVIAGLGGGTGTGATPVIIDLARSQGIEVIAVVVLPFEFETARRRAACQVVSELRYECSRLLIYDNASLPGSAQHRDLSVEAFFARQAQWITQNVRGSLQGRVLG